MKNTASPYLLRSLMFVPAHNDRLLASAAKSNADVLLLDIEDSVQPESNKPIARSKIVEYVERGDFARHLVFPRINDRESGHLLKDLMALTIPGINGFVVPKSETGSDVYFIDKLLDTIEFEKGVPQGTFKIIPLIETAGAVLNAQDICKASNRVVAIAFGCEDYINDLEGVHDSEGQSIYTARAMIAMAARANGVAPIDTVHIRVHDLQHLEENLQLAKKLGFEGMLVLNPKEIPLVHQYFSPTDQEVADALEMIRLAKEAEEAGKGVAVVGNKFIGPPMVRAAEKVCLRQTLIEKKEKMQ
jgi:citrate lyase subunit beta/citryl-CoA lyase